jgi:hypothetical protein
VGRISKSEAAFLLPAARVWAEQKTHFRPGVLGERCCRETRWQALEHLLGKLRNYTRNSSLNILRHFLRQYHRFNRSLRLTGLNRVSTNGIKDFVAFVETRSYPVKTARVKF